MTTVDSHVAVGSAAVEVGRWRRVRWAVRAVLVLGVAASVAANVLHAPPNLIAQLVAAWPPVALLVTVELLARVPVHRRWLAVARVSAAAVITGIAAWVSYWHMAAVAARYGETGLTPYLLPLSVDGLIVVASASLVELAGRIRAAASPTASTSPTADRAATAPKRAVVAGAPAPGQPATPSVPAGQPVVVGRGAPRPVGVIRR